MSDNTGTLIYAYALSTKSRKILNMPNIANILKTEIVRIARKEVRAEVDGLRKLVAAQRSAIAALRKEVADLGKQLKRVPVSKPAEAASVATPENDGVERRFSAARLATHRQKLGLSATDYGLLVGASDQSVYKWEQGKTRPQAEMVRKLSMLKEIPKSEISQRLEQLRAAA